MLRSTFSSLVLRSVIDPVGAVFREVMVHRSLSHTEVLLWKVQHLVMFSVPHVWTFQWSEFSVCISFHKKCTTCGKKRLAPCYTKPHMPLSPSVLHHLAWLAAVPQPPLLGGRIYPTGCLMPALVAGRILYLWHLAEQDRQAGSLCSPVQHWHLTTGVSAAWLLLAVDAWVMHRKSLAKSHRVLFFRSIGETPLVTMVDNSWKPSSLSFFFLQRKWERERERG